MEQANIGEVELETVTDNVRATDMIKALDLSSDQDLSPELIGYLCREVLEGRVLIVPCNSGLKRIIVRSEGGFCLSESNGQRKLTIQYSTSGAFIKKNEEPEMIPDQPLRVEQRASREAWENSGRSVADEYGGMPYNAMEKRLERWMAADGLE